jgi:hypothetical protein
MQSDAKTAKNGKKDKSAVPHLTVEGSLLVEKREYETNEINEKI